MTEPSRRPVADAPGAAAAADAALTGVGADPPGGAPIAAGYAAAQQELEAILGELERSDVDVDRLAQQVQRASQLIAFCRERIVHARAQIDQVVGGLGDDRG